MRTLRTPWLAFIILAALGGKKLLGAEIQHWQSGPQAVQLIELYTSEGCYSCPPADAWLSGLKNHPDLWTSLFPIALHVDYWNYLGWQDQFSLAEFSQRQRRYAREGLIATVYTPGLVVDGREWKGFFGDRQLPPRRQIETGVLELSLANTQLQARFHPRNPHIKKLDFHLAVLGFNIRSRISSGENTGKLLQHDFVVLQHQQHTVHIDPSSFHWNTQLDKPLHSGAKNLALLVWVNASHDLTPLQAAGGLLKMN